MAGRGGNKGAGFTKQLRINSSNRVDLLNSSDSDFSIDVGPSLQLVKRLSITGAQFNNVFYNVFQTSIKWNTYFQMIIVGGADAGSYSLGIPAGYYSAYTLYTAITDAISTATGATTLFAFTLNSTTNKVSATVTAPVGTTSVTISALTLLQQATVNLAGRQDYNPFGLLGFILPQVWVPSVTTNTAFYFPSLNNPSVAYILSKTLAPMNSFDEKGNISNILIPINITAPFNSLCVFECQQDILCEIDYGKNPRALNRIDIQLVDHDLDVLDLHQTELNIDCRVWLDSF
jgi:hypothetical protein